MRYLSLQLNGCNNIVLVFTVLFASATDAEFGKDLDCPLVMTQLVIAFVQGNIHGSIRHVLSVGVWWFTADNRRG